MIIARLYEGELDQTPPSLKKLIYEEILGFNAEGEDYNPSRAHPDPFLRSMALWILKDYTGSLNTLLHTNIGTMHPQYIDEDKPEGGHANPNVFNFYVYLRTHPLLIRQYIASTAQDKNKGRSVNFCTFFNYTIIMSLLFLAGCFVRVQLWLGLQILKPGQATAAGRFNHSPGEAVVLHHCPRSFQSRMPCSCA
jgi:hypothetical protein